MQPRVGSSGSAGRTPMRSLLLALWLALAAPLSAQEHLEVRFLDVGQGDAVLVQHAGRALLYDAGPRGAPTADRLRALGIDTLALLVASHPHADHIGGMADVVKSVEVLAYMDSGAEHTTVSYAELMEAMEAREVPVVDPHEAGRITMGDAVLHVLPPPEDAPDWSLNDRSVGLRICLADGCLMLGGDAEHQAWERWLDTAADKITPVSVHKASHHGSANGDTREAMAVLSPEVVVIGVGEGNRFDHPRPKALRLYRDAGARVLRTDYHGGVVVHLARDGTLRTWVERWPEPLRWPLPRWPWGVLR